MDFYGSEEVQGTICWALKIFPKAGVLFCTPHRDFCLDEQSQNNWKRLSYVGITLKTLLCSVVM